MYDPKKHHNGHLPGLQELTTKNHPIDLTPLKAMHGIANQKRHEEARKKYLQILANKRLGRR